jgi:hypothetical protein
MKNTPQSIHSASKKAQQNKDFLCLMLCAPYLRMRMKQLTIEVYLPSVREIIASLTL